MSTPSPAASPAALLRATRSPVRGRSVCQLRRSKMWWLLGGFWLGLGPCTALGQPCAKTCNLQPRFCLCLSSRRRPFLRCFSYCSAALLFGWGWKPSLLGCGSLVPVSTLSAPHSRLLQFKPT